MPSRRKFLATVAAPALIGLPAKAQRTITGGFVNDSYPIGHRLRDRAAFAKASRTETLPVVIVGGGMAGLSAAWRDGIKNDALDRTTFADWLKTNRFESEYLRWYADYACRDDYGARAHSVSAWAGLHYFAARTPDDEDQGPLTWPEGNGWIARRLIAKLAKWIRPNAPVYAIAREGRKWRVRTETADFLAERVVFAAPSFLAPYLIEGAPRTEGMVYSPWLNANLTLDRLPAARGSETAWDNVIYNSPALGYVSATHMSLRTVESPTVWTYYWALADDTPEAGRKRLLDRDWGYWRDAILADLEKAHPDIRQCVARIDLMRMGHAMARPVPGFLGSIPRKRLAKGGAEC